MLHADAALAGTPMILACRGRAAIVGAQMCVAPGAIVEIAPPHLLAAMIAGVREVPRCDVLLRAISRHGSRVIPLLISGGGL